MFVRKYRQLSGTDLGGHGTLPRLVIVGIMDDLGFQIGTGKEGRTREQDVCSHTVRSFADQYSLCTLFTVQEVDCIRKWGGLARIATAIDLNAKGDLLVAACRELEYKNALSAALFKQYFNFDDGSCLQFLDWLFDPSNYGTAPHGDVLLALQNIEVEYLVSREKSAPRQRLCQSLPKYAFFASS